MTPQAQPYRKGSSRPVGPANRAMKRGRPALMQHPSTAKRQLAKRKKRKRKRNALRGVMRRY